MKETPSATVLKREVLDNLFNQQYIHILTYKTRLLRNPNSSSAIYLLRQLPQEPPGRKRQKDSYSWNVRIGRTLKCHEMEEFFLHTSSTSLKCCQEQQPLCPRQSLQFFNGSDLASFSLQILSTGPGSALGTMRQSPIPRPCDSYRVNRVFSFFGPMFPVTST